jgi:hypothetical protein
MPLGGFADTINLFKTYDPVTAGDIAIALAKIIFAIPVGIVISGFFLNIAVAIVETWGKRPWFAKTDESVAGKRRSLGYDD